MMAASALEHLVLELLVSRGPTYGLDLVSESNGRLKRGSVYVTLGRMEQKGFVTSRLDERPGDGPSRRLYDLTALGKRALIAGRYLRGDAVLGEVLE
jgi:PadR family transcriptional regulator, regulatory protein PadR